MQFSSISPPPISLQVSISLRPFSEVMKQHHAPISSIMSNRKLTQDDNWIEDILNS